jgi:hypothetical protein
LFPPEHFGKLQSKTKQTTNQVMSNNEISSKKFSINIADRTGHSTVANLSLDETVNNIVENIDSKSRWLFINGEAVNFKGAGSKLSNENISTLRTTLESLNDPTILLTGTLVGGVN